MKAYNLWHNESPLAHSADIMRNALEGTEAEYVECTYRNVRRFTWESWCGILAAGTKRWKDLTDTSGAHAVELSDLLDMREEEEERLKDDLHSGCAI